VEWSFCNDVSVQPIAPYSRVKTWTSWLLIGCPETSVHNYRSVLRNIPEERRCHLHRCVNTQTASNNHFKFSDFAGDITDAMGEVRDVCVSVCCVWVTVDKVSDCHGGQNVTERNAVRSVHTLKTEAAISSETCCLFTNRHDPRRRTPRHESERAASSWSTSSTYLLCAYSTAVCIRRAARNRITWCKGKGHLMT
jgi:hypothetical protein